MGGWRSGRGPFPRMIERPARESRGLFQVGHASRFTKMRRNDVKIGQTVEGSARSLACMLLL